MSTLHWTGAALSLVAYVIKNVDQISQNKEWKSLLFDIMKLLNQMGKCWTYLDDEKTKKQLEDFAQSIIRGAVIFWSFTKQHNILFKYNEYLLSFLTLLVLEPRSMVDYNDKTRIALHTWKCLELAFKKIISTMHK